MNSERGTTPVELALGVMLLVVPVAILVLSVAPVFEHRNFVRRAAAEAARTMVLTTGDPEAEALAVVDAQAQSMGIDPANVTVVLCGGAACVVDRGAVVTVDVTVTVEEVSSFLPIGTITVHAVHSEQVDTYRSRP
jgi:Flp pilus assembly protein TadG